MGVKLITEKDFWMCTEGAVPAPLQGTHLSLKKKNGDSVFITVADKATASWIDFGCKKYMVLVAIAVALVAVALVVAGVITVATGGLGLFAIGAIAGVVGGVIGAVVGGLLCGQKMVSKREWLTQGKANFISQGANTITSEHKMICPIGGEIAFAPHVKSWLDAILMAGASYASSLIECAMTGGMIGSMGGALMGSGGLLASAKTVFGQGWKAVGKSVLGFLKNTPKVVLNNLIKKDTSEIVATASQSLLGSYGKDGKLTSDSVLDATHEVFLSDVESVKNILTGNGSPSDIISVAALMIPGDSNGKKTKNTDSVGNSKTESEGGHRHSETMDSSHTEKSTSTSATSPEATNVSQHKVDQGGNVSNLNKSETSDMHTNSGDSSHGTNSSDASTISDGETNVNQHKTKEEPSNVAEDKSPSEETTSKEHQIDEQEAKGNEEAKDDIDKQKEETDNDSAEDTKSKTHADSNDGKKTIGEEAEAYSEGGDKHIEKKSTSGEEMVDAGNGHQRKASDPEGTFRDKDGRLRDAKGRYTKDPNKVPKEVKSDPSNVEFDPNTATNKQKGNYGEIRSREVLTQNPALQRQGYDLEPIGRTKETPLTINDSGHQGIDGIYKNNTPPPSYIIDEAKYNTSQLGTLEDGTRQMSDDWINSNDRLQTACGKEADKIKEAMKNGDVEKILTRVDTNGNVTISSIDSAGKVTGPWPNK